MKDTLTLTTVLKQPPISYSCKKKFPGYKGLEVTMSDFKTPLNGNSMQEGFEKVKMTEKQRLEELDKKLKDIVNRLKIIEQKNQDKD